MDGGPNQQTVFLPTGDPEDVDVAEASYPYPGMIGMKFTVFDPPRQVPTDDATQEGHAKQYQLVRTDSSMATAPYKGASAWWQNTSRYRVTTDPTALGRGRVAGVFTRTITVGNLTTIQKRGPINQMKFVDAPTADPTIAGLIVIPSATAGKADALGAGTAATYPIMGKTISAIDGNREADVELNVDDGVL